jgi:hypothetical protein
VEARSRSLRSLNCVLRSLLWAWMSEAPVKRRDVHRLLMQFQYRLGGVTKIDLEGE